MRFNVKCNRSMVLVPTEKIMYISSDKRRLTIHTADGETVFYGKISKITDELSFSLLQIHKSGNIHYFFGRYKDHASVAFYAEKTFVVSAVLL